MKNDSRPTDLPAFTFLNDRYCIQQYLGSGNFGIVYKAYEVEMKRFVAIKEFFPRSCATRHPTHFTIHSLGGEEFKIGRKLFAKESENLAQIQHPNVISIFYTFQENNTSYIVMPFLEGHSLADITESLTLKDAWFNYIRPVCDACSTELHPKDIIHQDITPNNIFLIHKKNKEIPVLIDFGAAKNIFMGSINVAAIVTPGYGAPEQYAKDSKKSYATDIYGLAATLTWLFTGERPPDSVSRFEQDDPYLKMLKEKTKLTEEQIQVLRKAMHPQQQKRYQTVAEFQEDMDQAIHQQETKKWYEHKLFWLALAGLLTCIVGLSIFFKPGVENERSKQTTQQAEAGTSDAEDKLFERATQQAKAGKLEDALATLKNASSLEIVTLRQRINEVKGIVEKHSMVFLEAKQISIENQKVMVPSFYMDKYEVSNREFKNFIDSRPEKKLTFSEEQAKHASRASEYTQAVKFNGTDYIALLEHLPTWRKPYTEPDWQFDQILDHPVVHITWGEAQEYCEHYGKTLPNNREWMRSLVNWENQITKAKHKIAAGRKKYIYTMPVNAPGDNHDGIYHLLGNVSEFVSNCPSDHAKTCQNKAYRGGAFGSLRYELGKLVRKGSKLPSQEIIRGDLGFRCVLSNPFNKE